MGYMFRLLSSHLQTLKEYRSNYQGCLNALWDPQCLQNNYCNNMELYIVDNCGYYLYHIQFQTTETVYGIDIIHIYPLYVIPRCYNNYSVSTGDPTVRLNILGNWIRILWGPEDDSIGVETCSPCIYGYRYINKLLCCVRLLHIVP